MAMYENMVGNPSSGDLLCIVNDLTGNETELEIVSLAGPFHQVDDDDDEDDDDDDNDDNHDDDGDDDDDELQIVSLAVPSGLNCFHLY